MFPRTVVVLGQANLADVRQTAIGSIIRVAQQGAVQELTKPFMGKEALPVMEVLEAIRESRTGITRASQGLTVDELQSTAPVAVSAADIGCAGPAGHGGQDAGRDRAGAAVHRAAADDGAAAGPAERDPDQGPVGAIDPRASGHDVGDERQRGWERNAAGADGDARPDSGEAGDDHGAGGLQNPLAGIPEYRNTLARMLETAGISDVSSYFKTLPPGFQPPPQPQPPNTDLILAQVQGQKTAADVENDAGGPADEAGAICCSRTIGSGTRRRWMRGRAPGWRRRSMGRPRHHLTSSRTAMASRVTPAVGMLGDLPTPSSPQPPATGLPGRAAAPAGASWDAAEAARDDAAPDGWRGAVHGSAHASGPRYDDGGEGGSSWERLTYGLRADRRALYAFSVNGDPGGHNSPRGAGGAVAAPSAAGA